jgi:hypothetical protein
MVIILFQQCKKDSEYFIDDSLGVVVKMWEKYDTKIFNKTVIIYDNDYLIKTCLDTFILGHPLNSSSYEELRNIAISDSKYKDILKATYYLKRENEYSGMLAYFLATGKCYIYDKHEKTNIIFIQVKYYHEGEPMAASGGRRFYIKNKLFLTTIDWISKK